MSITSLFSLCIYVLSFVTCCAQAQTPQESNIVLPDSVRSVNIRFAQPNADFLFEIQMRGNGGSFSNSTTFVYKMMKSSSAYFFIAYHFPTSKEDIALYNNALSQDYCHSLFDPARADITFSIDYKDNPQGCKDNLHANPLFFSTRTPEGLILKSFIDSAVSHRLYSIKFNSKTVREIADEVLNNVTSINMWTWNITPHFDLKYIYNTDSSFIRLCYNCDTIQYDKVISNTGLNVLKTWKSFVHELFNQKHAQRPVCAQNNGYIGLCSCEHLIVVNYESKINPHVTLTFFMNQKTLEKILKSYPNFKIKVENALNVEKKNVEH